MSAPSPWMESPAALLADHAWARRLARQLVRDPGLAEDLAQEACVRALQHPPAREPRAWLGGIVRNLARELRRGSSRRARREASVARPEAQPSAADALERLAAQQSVVRAVLALEEPYRSTVVLRFYDGLPPRKIAAREGVPVATVKTRLTRALAQLRTALDREHKSDGRSWALALLPLAACPGGLAPLLAGTALMNTLVKSALAAAALVLVVWFARREPRAGAPHQEADPAASAVLELAASKAIEPVSVPAPRVSAAPATTPAAPEPEPASAEQVTGRVIDADGNPVAGVELGLRASNGAQGDPEVSLEGVGGSTFGSILWSEPLDEDGPPLATSGADGAFAFVLPPGKHGNVVSRDPFWESVVVPEASAARGLGPTLVVAPRFRLAGVVRDGAGAPLAEVDLCFGVPRERLHASGYSLEDTLAPGWSTTSDAEGRFELARLPAVPGAILRARLAPYETRRIEREAWSDDELEIVLERASGAWLEGVVEARGEPVPDAYVALGVHATRTDARGAFQIPLDGRARETELCAAAAGFLPARVTGDLNEDGTTRWPSFVRLELDGEPRVLAGTVVDAEGRPLAGQEIWLGEGRAVLNDQLPFLLESILAGKREARLGTKSDADGRFELGGLEAHDYELRVIDPRTALLSDAGPFTAGRTDLRLVQPTDLVWPVVRGVVLSVSGEPVPGLRVQVERESDLVGVPSAMYFGYSASGARAETDANGAFELRGVPRNGVQLSVFSTEIVDPAFALAADIDPLNVRIVVARWVRLEVHVAGSATAGTNIGVLDAAGRPLAMESASNSGTSTLHRLGLVDGRSPVVKVSDRAAFVVLYDAASELGRQAVVLRSSEINRVEF